MAKDSDRENRLATVVMATWGFVYARTVGPDEALAVAMALVGALIERCQVSDEQARAWLDVQLALVDRKPNGST